MVSWCWLIRPWSLSSFNWQLAVGSVRSVAFPRYSPCPASWEPLVFAVWLRSTFGEGQRRTQKLGREWPKKLTKSHARLCWSHGDSPISFLKQNLVKKTHHVPCLTQSKKLSKIKKNNFCDFFSALYHRRYPEICSLINVWKVSPGYLLGNLWAKVLIVDQAWLLAQDR